jgi:putative membrane protein
MMEDGPVLAVIRASYRPKIPNRQSLIEREVLTMKRLPILFMLAIASASIGLVQQNLGKSSLSQDMKAKVSDVDKSFMMKAADAGMAEVELGQLALKQATNDDVKRFAQRMVDDHSKAGQELKQFADSKGVTLPAMVSASPKKLFDKMSKLSGAAFDREYMSEMVKDHEKAVALFESQSKSGKDMELKAWVDKTLPTLREHLQLARDTASKVGAKAD